MWCDFVMLIKYIFNNYYYKSSLYTATAEPRRRVCLRSRKSKAIYDACISASRRYIYIYTLHPYKHTNIKVQYTSRRVYYILAQRNGRLSPGSCVSSAARRDAKSLNSPLRYDCFFPTRSLSKFDKAGGQWGSPVYIYYIILLPRRFGNRTRSYITLLLNYLHAAPTWEHIIKYYHYYLLYSVIQNKLSSDFKCLFIFSFRVISSVGIIWYIH